MLEFFRGNLVATVLLLRVLVCAGALCADRLWEKIPLPQRLHPVVLFGSLATRGERALNHEGFVSRFWRGALLCGGLVVLAFGAGCLTEHLLAQAGWIGTIAGGVVLCGLLIAHASLDRHVACVEARLREGDIRGARACLAHIVGRETKALSQHHVGRAALESLSENCSDGTVAPLFYYLIFGLGGLFAYKAINTLDSMFGYRGVRYGLFGRWTARMDDVANIVPSRLTAGLFCVTACFLRGCSGRDALRVVRCDALSLRAWAREGFVSSPNALHPEAAMAGALGVRLGGRREYRMHGEVWQAGKQIGDGRTRCESSDLARARRLVDVAVLSFAVLGVAGVGGGWGIFR